jgi:hypothetical protein
VLRHGDLGVIAMNAVQPSVSCSEADRDGGTTQDIPNKILAELSMRAEVVRRVGERPDRRAGPEQGDRR